MNIGYERDTSEEEPPPSVVKCWLASCLILTANLLEHIAYYGFVNNISFLLTSQIYRWHIVNANAIVSLISSIFMLTAYVGGFLADFVLHRILLISVIYIGYLFGIFGLKILDLNSNGPNNSTVPMICSAKQGPVDPQYHLSSDATWMNSIHQGNQSNILLNSINMTSEPAFPFLQEDCAGFVIATVALVGIGSGVARVILMVLGADQVRPLGEHSIRIYFLIYYLTSNIGATISDASFGLQNSALGHWQLIAMGSLLCISIFLLLAGRRLYVIRRQDNNFIKLTQTVKEIILRWCSVVPDDIDSVAESRFDKAKLTLGGQADDDDVEGVKRITYTYIILLFILPYSLMSRLYIMFPFQAKRMKIPVSENKDGFVNSIESSFTIVGVLFVLVLMLGIGVQMSVRTRFYVGMLLLASSLTCAGVMERFRLLAFWGNNHTTIQPAPSVFNQTYGPRGVVYQAADMNMFWLLPQYLLIAFAEVFVFLTTLEYTYLLNVPWLQCTAVGTIWASLGMGTLLNNLWVYGLDGSVYHFNDINYRRPCLRPPKILNNTSTSSPWVVINEGVYACWESRLDYFYMICTLSMLFMVGISIVVCRKCFPTLFSLSSLGIESRLLTPDEDAYVSEEEEEDEDDWMMERHRTSLLPPVREDT